ncbi:hypothetical protein [Clavibacter zhangzhiyongii]|uniref:hypothetical protein n=1 Tax=Clavibacter zhangzhiyongii TaxID=2768071 RepID=UPI0039E0D4CD
MPSRPSGARKLLSGVVVPFVAIVVAGVLAALIARGATQRILTRHDREVKAAAIAVLVDAARQASAWDGLTPQERVLADRAAGEADIRIRLLPVKGRRHGRDLGRPRDHGVQARQRQLRLPVRHAARGVPRPHRRVAAPPGARPQDLPGRHRPLAVRGRRTRRALGARAVRRAARGDGGRRARAGAVASRIRRPAGRRAPRRVPGRAVQPARAVLGRRQLALRRGGAPLIRSRA